MCISDEADRFTPEELVPEQPRTGSKTAFGSQTCDRIHEIENVRTPSAPAPLSHSPVINGFPSTYVQP